MTMRYLSEALVDHLSHMLAVEQRGDSLLNWARQQVSSTSLKTLLDEHQRQTRCQTAYLRQCFDLLGRSPASAETPAIDGLARELTTAADRDAAPMLRDAMLTAGLRRLEQYEISAYALGCDWAERLGRSETSLLLQQILAEERRADRELARIADALAREAAA